MSNKQIAYALALALESAAVLAAQLSDSLNDDNDNTVERRAAVTSVQAAISDAVPTFVAEVAPAAAPVVEAKSPLEIISDMLHDERYTLRSLSSLAEKSGLSEGDVIYELDNTGIDYVEKTKRGSGATLIGLASRN